ncbi:MAG: 4Fe-4S dicluster domain-containing protein [Thermodesulfobacteriota bacterium]|nr:MAG: 4Fe-4S dicluster domain-containing protein [Thermodesulfobacteriota bacterium]
MVEDYLKPLEEKTLAEKLFLLKFEVDKESHLIVNAELCRECEERACLDTCPSGVYSWEEDKKEVTISYEGCLECGTCRIACGEGAIEWRNPRGGFGVSYRFG